ncbi:MAG: hypothetical protein ROW48_05095 [Bellilinea sp.]|jgi:hypothetical protein
MLLGRLNCKEGDFSCQQVCKSHVVRNTEDLINTLSQAIETAPAKGDPSLAGIQLQPAQALADLRQLGELIHSRQPGQQAQLLALYERYAQAEAPRKGKATSIAYRMRNLLLDPCWNLWPRLTFYRTWKDEQGKHILDGTNNASEHAIGWWVKERYRSMRGYKRQQSMLNVSRLIAHCGNHLAMVSGFGHHCELIRFIETSMRCRSPHSLRLTNFGTVTKYPGPVVC